MRLLLAIGLVVTLAAGPPSRLRSPKHDGL